jgi:hypothetical protein
MKDKTEKYVFNPKTEGSGIICAIPQKGNCPYQCTDFFFQSVRSYLEPLDENTPNLPPLEMMKGRIVRINDGNDSNNERETVIEYVNHLKLNGIDCFVNTSKPRLGFGVPVVLTVNPGMMTDVSFHEVPPSNDIMFVRFRANTWNRDLLIKCVDYYTTRGVSVVVTFMAYYKSNPIPEDDKINYRFRKRTLNSYWAITTNGWESVMKPFKYNKYVSTCGKIEGEKGDTHCKFCGNCIREYFNAKERGSVTDIPFEQLGREVDFYWLKDKIEERKIKEDGKAK